MLPTVVEVADTVCDADCLCGCVAVAGMNLPVCPREALLSVNTGAGSGHLSNFVGAHRGSSRIGSDACPWQLTVRPGQKLRLRDIVIPSQSRPTSSTTQLNAGTCSDVYVIKARRLYTYIHIYISRLRHDASPSVRLSVCLRRKCIGAL